MTRMWNLPPEKLCTRHLLGEHKELHQAVGSINKGKSLKGHIEKGQIEVHNIRKRHAALVKEMRRRGFKHESPLPKFRSFHAGKINLKFNEADLIKRCRQCRKRFNSYIIPFKKRPVKIGQGFHGRSHRNWPEDKEDFSYSLDFLLPEGTEIIASRAGKITKIKINGKKNYAGKDPKKGETAYKKWMNEIEIMHNDGTFAAYAHLKYKSSSLKTGDGVERGQKIASSGNTGWSSAPHLDFTVFRKNYKGDKIKSVKIKFEDYSGSLENKKLK